MWLLFQVHESNIIYAKLSDYIGVKNPIKVARRLLEGQRNPKPMSLVAPAYIQHSGGVYLTVDM